MRSYTTRKGNQLYASRAYFMQRLLPYGIWRCEDGREVLFDRDYAPICQRYPGKRATLADGREWVHWKSQDYFYDDGTRDAAKRRVALSVLDEWGVIETVLAANKEIAARLQYSVGFHR